MYYLFGLEKNCSNLAQVLASYQGRTANEQYANFLLDHSPLATLTDSAMPTFSNVHGMRKYCPSYYEQVRDFFVEDNLVNDLRIADGFFVECLDDLQTRDADLYRLVVLLVKLVVVHRMKDYVKGTSDDTFGIMILNGKPHFVVEDYTELLVHQATHMLMFMDDFLDPHVLAAHKNRPLVTSIRNVMGSFESPFYVALHSLMVGVEILYFRKSFGLLEFHGNFHGSTEALLRRCKTGLLFVEQKDHLLLRRGKAILDQIKQRIKSFEEAYPLCS